jgi:hypothetical protein
MKIYAPNIHLFAFELYKAVNFDKAIQAEEIFLWQSADYIVKKTLNQDLHLAEHVDLDKEPENQRVGLIKESEVLDGDYSIPIKGEISQVTITGLAYPLRIYNSSKVVDGDYSISISGK